MKISYFALKIAYLAHISESSQISHKLDDLLAKIANELDSIKEKGDTVFPLFGNQPKLHDDVIKKMQENNGDKPRVIDHTYNTPFYDKMIEWMHFLNKVETDPSINTRRRHFTQDAIMVTYQTFKKIDTILKRVPKSDADISMQSYDAHSELEKLQLDITDYFKISGEFLENSHELSSFDKFVQEKIRDAILDGEELLARFFPDDYN